MLPSPCIQVQVRRPRGFTLIEMLVVVMVIAILAAIITPAVMRGFGSARDAKVKIEITQLASAITAFKAAYGVEPPSRIVLCEAGGTAGWNTTAALGGASVAEIQRSKGLIKRIWPKFDFTTAHSGSFNRDINNDGDATDVLLLNGSECLAFFLGGVCLRTDSDGDSVLDLFTTQGFSKNPVRPFASMGATGESREGPFFEFDSRRFTDLDGDLIPEFRDSLPEQTGSYAYFSSYDGLGYDTSDAFAIGGVTLNPYFLVTEDVDLDSTLDAGEDRITTPAATITILEFHNPKSFQIISPGVDGLHGVGGMFDAKRVRESLSYGRPAPADPVTPYMQGRAEYDNLTNFNAGRLFPQ